MAKRKQTGGKRGPGRPARGEPLERVTVILLRSQVVWLDRLSVDIRAKTGSAINRAALIRGMLAAVQEAGIDVTGAASEADIQAAIRRAVKS